MQRFEKARYFRDMHQERRAFTMPNPWDFGTARIFEHLGFEAIATTSAGLAFSKGRPDQTITRDEALEHAAQIASSVEIPVSGDFENGFSDNPDGVAETVRMAADAGLAGVSIEDLRPGGEPYDFEWAVERIGAALEAARSVDIVLCARADGVMEGVYDLEEAERRITAFAGLGVDCIYVPRLPDLVTIRRLAKIAPLNVLMGFGPRVSVAELRVARVGRISLGSALARTAYGAAFDAAKQIIEDGHFTLAEQGGRKTGFDAALLG